MKAFVALFLMALLGYATGIYRGQSWAERAHTKAEGAAGTALETEEALEDGPGDARESASLEPSTRVSLLATEPITVAERVDPVELRKRVSELEDALNVRDVQLDVASSRLSFGNAELLVLGSPAAYGPVKTWLGSLQDHERPAPDTIRRMAYLFDDTGLGEVSADEGLWIAERIAEGDWKAWADTIEEALLQRFEEDRFRTP